MLALRLAQEFVPGFRVVDKTYQRGRGRTRIWDSQKFAELMADVEDARVGSSKSDSECCRILATSPKYRRRWGKFTHRTLCNKLIQARDENYNFVALLANRIRATGSMPEVEFKHILMEVFGINKKQE
jgi:hypothetical protein